LQVIVPAKQQGVAWITGATGVVFPPGTVKGSACGPGMPPFRSRVLYPVIPTRMRFQRRHAPDLQGFGHSRAVCRAGMADLSWILGMKIAFAVFIRRVRERRVSYGFSSRETSLDHAGNITGTRGINAREMEHRSSLVPGNETVSRTIGIARRIGVRGSRVFPSGNNTPVERDHFYPTQGGV